MRHSKTRLVAAILIGVTFSPSIFAMPSDVNSSDWFAGTVSNFEDKGYLSSSESFRPGDEATRGEFIKLIVELLGGIRSGPFSAPEFDDVDSANSLFEYFEEAGAQFWLKGDGSCYQNIRPCNAYPDRPINRAEAATLIMRAFNKTPGDNTLDFEDNITGQWYWESIRSAASLCVLKGDTGKSRVRPGDNMNRAEMIVMLKRIHDGLKYPNCEESFQSNVLPDFPMRNQVEKKVQEQASSTPSSSYCTEEAWVCGGWSLCNPAKGIKTRPCELVDFDCKGAEKVNPVERQGCVKGRTPESMQEFTYYGYDLLRDMEATAYMVITTYSMQIFDVMRRYEKDLIMYSGITRNALVDKRWIGESIDDIELIERQLEALEAEYNRIEKVFRRPTGTGFQDELLPLPPSITDPTCEDLKRSINVYKRWDDAGYIRRALVATGCMLEEDYCRMYGVCEN